jgi:SAM-dependent methyltransferase
MTTLEAPPRVVLELGCGKRPSPGATLRHDRTKHAPHVDVAWDLNEMAWPMDDKSCDVVMALDVIEHVRQPLEYIMGELWRILRPGGQLMLRVPAWDSSVGWRDPQHVRLFTEETFAYFDPDQPLGQEYGAMYFPDGPWFTVLSVERTNPDRFGVGDIGVLLAKRERPVAG